MMIEVNGVNQATFKEAAMHFSFFEELQVRDQISELSIPKGTIVFNEGDECGAVAFVLKGTIRVSKIGENGREVNLYRVKSGDSCILTISSVLSEIDYPATATVEEDVDVILLPAKTFKESVTQNYNLQEYIYKLLAERFLAVMTLIDEIVFKKMDERVVQLLLERLHEDGDTLSMTHDEMAVELGTAREVVSRVLKGVEKEGLIHLLRGKVQLVNRKELLSKLHNTMK